MAKKAAQWTEAKLKAAKEKPKTIHPTDYKGGTLPGGYKECDACGHYVLGRNTKTCPNCEHRLVKEKSNDSKKQSSKNKVSVSDFQMIQSIIKLAGSSDNALKIINSIDHFESIEDAQHTLKSWNKLVETTGSEEIAMNTINALDDMGTI